MFKQEKDDSDCNNEFDRNIVQTFRYIHARHSGCVAHFQHDYLSITLEKKKFFSLPFSKFLVYSKEHLARYTLDK